MYGSCQNVTKRTVFHQSAILPKCLLWLQYICCSEDPGEQPSMTMFYICCIEGPGEQAGLTTKSLVREWYHKAVHPLACLLNALQYQLNENLQRPAAAALIKNR